MTRDSILGHLKYMGCHKPLSCLSPHFIATTLYTYPNQLFYLQYFTIKCRPGALQCLVQSLGHLLNGTLSLVGWQQVDLVQDNHHARARQLSYQQTLCSLSLYPLYHVHHQHHQVNDLGTLRRQKMQMIIKNIPDFTDIGKNSKIKHNSIVICC